MMFRFTGSYRWDGINAHSRSNRARGLAYSFYSESSYVARCGWIPSGLTWSVSGCPYRLLVRSQCGYWSLALQRTIIK